MTGQSRILRSFALATALLSIAGVQRATANPYSIDILIDPYHSGVVDSWLLDINNQSQSTGYIVQHVGTSFPRNAVTYRDGTVQVLSTASTFSGNLGQAGFGINNAGDVVANVDGNPYFVAAGDSPVPIDVPGKFASLYVAGLVPGGLNNSQNTLVSAYPNDPVDTPPNAFSGLAIWNPAGSAALSAVDPLYPYTNPPDPNDFNSGPSTSAGTASVTHLNNANQFAASVHQFDFDPKDPVDPDDDVFNEYFTHAYIYDGHGGYSLLVSPTAGDELRPIDIDEAGTVFGWAGDHLALWGSDGALQSVLPDAGTTLDEDGYNGFPTVQRNNLGQVVAMSSAGGVLFYDPVSNTWTDITASISGLGTGTFSSIQGFNDLGQFVGLVRPPQGGGVFGYVVSPVPEPSSFAICALGCVAVVAVRSRKPSSIRERNDE